MKFVLNQLYCAIGCLNYIRIWVACHLESERHLDELQNAMYQMIQGGDSSQMKRPKVFATSINH